MRPAPLCILVLFALLEPSAVVAQDAAVGGNKPQSAPTSQERQRDIQRRIERLADHPDARAAGGALEQARQALAAARGAVASGDVDAARRARQIAWAALALASHRVSLVQARAELEAARRRLRKACREAAAGHRALEAARAQRQALQDGGT